MLKVYRAPDDVPNGIRIVRDNDEYFNYNTLLQDNALTRDILSTIDKAEYISELTILGRTKSLGALNKQVLSTGTKTLLNILGSSSDCFDLRECGDNVLRFLPRVTDGHVIWDMPCLAYCGDPDCDIEYKGKRYRDFYEFLGTVEKEERGYDDI